MSALTNNTHSASTLSLESTSSVTSDTLSIEEIYVDLRRTENVAKKQYETAKDIRNYKSNQALIGGNAVRRPPGIPDEHLQKVTPRMMTPICNARKEAYKARRAARKAFEGELSREDLKSCRKAYRELRGRACIIL